MTSQFFMLRRNDSVLRQVSLSQLKLVRRINIFVSAPLVVPEMKRLYSIRGSCGVSLYVNLNGSPNTITWIASYNEEAVAELCINQCWNQ